MKYCVFCVVAGLTAASYGGWGLDSALKAVDKAASTVSGVNDSLQSSDQEPKTAGSTAVSSDGNGQQQSGADASRERPPMEKASPGRQPPTGAPAVPSGYDQTPSYSNAPKTKPPMATESAGSPSPTDAPAGPSYGQQVNAREVALRKECKDLIDAAMNDKSVSYDRAELEKVYDMIELARKTEGGSLSEYSAGKCREFLVEKIDAPKAALESEKKQKQKMLNLALKRLRAVVKECDELVSQCNDAMKSYESKASSMAARLPESVKSAQQKTIDGRLSSRGGVRVTSVELPKDDPFKAEVLMSMPPQVAQYEEGKKAGAYSESEDVDDIEKKTAILEKLKGEMARGLYDDYGFIATCKKVAASMESLSAEALKNAEVHFEYSLNDSSGVLTDAEKAKRRDEADKLKATLPQGEYVDKLVEMTDALKAEKEAFNVKRVARIELVEKLKELAVSEWKEALDAEPDIKERKLILKGVLAEVGVFDEPNQEAAKLVSQYFTQEELVAAAREENDSSNFWIGGTQFITDQVLVRSMLLEDDEWARRWRDGVSIMARQHVYYALYRNVKDQDTLLKLLDVEEINFDSCGMDSYGARDKAVFSLLSSDNLKKLDAARVSRLNAVKGKIIDCNGFYVGMPQRDYTLLKFEREEKGKGSVGGKLGRNAMSPMESITFDAKMRYEYLGVKKDGIEGLHEFVGKYVVGGNDSVGETKIDSSTSTGWIYVDSPKFDCQIRMYTDGDLRIRSTRGH